MTNFPKFIVTKFSNTHFPHPSSSSLSCFVQGLSYTILIKGKRERSKRGSWVVLVVVTVLDSRWCGGWMTRVKADMVAGEG